MFVFSVIVLDGASSFGSICIQLAHHWGAKVLTTSSSEDEKHYLQVLGVELAQIIELNQKNASLKSVAMLETGNLGVDIIVDQGIAQYPQVVLSYHENNFDPGTVGTKRSQTFRCLWPVTDILQLKVHQVEVQEHACAFVCVRACVCV
jgi:hypothetical protein